MPKYIPIRPDFVVGKDEKGQDVIFGTRHLLTIAMTYVQPPAAGLSTAEVFAAQDMRVAFDEAKEAGLDYVTLTDTQYNGLKNRVESCKVWTLSGPDIVQFLSDVRDAKSKPPEAEKDDAASTSARRKKAKAG